MASSAKRELDLVRRQSMLHPMLRALPPSARDEVIRRGSMVFLNPGEKLYESVADAKRIFVVLSGALQIELPPVGFTRGPVVAMLPAPCILGECQVLHGRPWSGTGVALLPLTALRLSKPVLESLVLRHSTFALALYRELALRFLGAIDGSRTDPRATPPQQLAAYLLSYLRVCELAGAKTKDVEVGQAELGRATGLRRETVNRLLRQWDRAGLVKVGHASVRAIRADKLAKLVRPSNPQKLVRHLTPEGVMFDLHAHFEAIFSVSENSWRKTECTRLPTGGRCKAIGLSVLTELDVVSPYSAEIMNALVERFGPDHLKNTRFAYNGHETAGKLSLFPMLKALSLAQGDMVSAPYSGMMGIKDLVIWQLPHRTDRPRLRMPRLKHLSEGSAAALTQAAEAAAARGQVLVIDKGGPLVKAMTPRLAELIRTGTIRFLIHNADDRRDLETLGPDIFAIDVSSSPMKRLEARIIGEEMALLGSAEVRAYLGKNISEVPVYVVGYGLLGENIARAFTRLGYPKKNITIVELDPCKRALAQRRGYSARGPGSVGYRPAQGLAYIATPGAAVDARTIHDFAKDTLFLGVTSAGKGFQIDELRAKSQAFTLTPNSKCNALAKKATTRALAMHWEPGRVLHDVELVIREEGAIARTTRSKILTLGYSYNLLLESWPERYAVTSGVVAAAVAEVVALDSPGIRPMDSKFQRWAIRRFAAHGLGRFQPLAREYYEGHEQTEFAPEDELTFFRPAPEM